MLWPAVVVVLVVFVVLVVLGLVLLAVAAVHRFLVPAAVAASSDYFVFLVLVLVVDLLLDRQLYFYGSGVEDPEKLFQENLRKKDEAGMKTTGSGDEGSIYEGGKLADGDSCAESDDGDHAQLKK